MNTFNAIVSLVNEGQKLQAIKLLRETQQNLGLKNSKDIVDLIANGSITEYELQKHINNMTTEDAGQYKTHLKSKQRPTDLLFTREKKNYLAPVLLFVIVVLVLLFIFVL